MRGSLITISQLVLALGLSHAMGAQGPTVQPGDRVRLTLPTASADPVVGTVERVRPDTIFVRTSVDVLSALPLDQLTRLERSRGMRRPMWADIAPLWMPVAGAGVAAMLGAAKPASRTSPKDSAGFLAVFGGVIGVVAGFSTAIAVDPKESWETVPTRSGSHTSLAPSLYVAPAARGLTLGLHASF